MNSESLDKKPIGTDEVSIREIIHRIKSFSRYLYSKWITVVIFAVVGGTLGYVYFYIKKPVYTATTTFALEEGGEGGGALGQYAGLASMVGIDMGGGGGMFQGDNILELYKSRSMIQKALLSKTNLNGSPKLLIDRYIEFNKLDELWDHDPDLQKLNFADSLKTTVKTDSIIKIISKDINERHLKVIKPDKKLSIIKVEVTSKDEWFAKAFSEQIVSNVNHFYVETKTKKSSDNVAILQKQTDSIRRELSGAISGVATAMDANPNANPARQILRAPSQRRQIDVQANVAILTELVKNLEISKVSLRKETPLIQIIDEPILPLDKEKVNMLKAMIIGVFLGVMAVIFCLMIKKFLSSI